ncbi:hypothetical protein NL676_025365 [Syzygium grande]|nr:hypothetical protein NL676_025365 [Syzygium grande]
MEDLELELELQPVGGDDDHMMRQIENGSFFDGVPEDGDEAGDPAKLSRKQRNKEAAKGSRQRKKEYVKQLEGKSKYYEEECWKLGRLLRCFMAENRAFMAENRALQCRLQNCVCDANVAKQEPAVLSGMHLKP